MLVYILAVALDSAFDSDGFYWMEFVAFDS